MARTKALGEIHKGVTRLAQGSRRARLTAWVEQDLLRRFKARVLNVNLEIAVTWGRLQGDALRAKAPIPVIDSLIGATALVHDCAVVTRNATDIERTGAETIDLWEQ